MRLVLLGLLLCLFLPARAADAPTEKDKIEHLLACMEKSDLTFVRNGKAYSGKDAAGHLRMKWNSVGDKVKTAREFIGKIGTASSTSGKPYLVRDKEGAEKPLGPWLTAALDAFEAEKPK